MDFEKYLKDGNVNESFYDEIKSLNKQDYQMLKDAYYKISDGVTQMDYSFKNISMSLGMSGSYGSDFTKEYKIFLQMKKVFKQSNFGKIL